MLIFAVALFVLAAIFGLILITKVFKGVPRPNKIILAHGLFAATGLVLVLIYVLQNAERSPVASLIVFAIAALGGFLMFGLDMSKKPVPKGLAVVHASAAVIGLILLIVFILGV
jgi:hypothetical protein